MSSIPEFKDILGNLLKAGDFVAWAAGSRGAKLNIGIIKEVTSTKGTTWDYQAQAYANVLVPVVKLRVYQVSPEYLPGTYTATGRHTMHIRNTTTGNTSAMVIITNVPTEIADFLKSGDKERRPAKPTLSDFNPDA